MAEEYGCSPNAMLRIMVRACLGLSLPRGLDVQFPPE